MNKQYSYLKCGDRINSLIYGKGTIISDIGVGYIIMFDNGKTVSVYDGLMKRIRAYRRN